MAPEPVPAADYVVELRRASAALSRANQLAVEPWRSMSGALLDAVIALEELVEDPDACRSAGQDLDDGSVGQTGGLGDGAER